MRKALPQTDIALLPQTDIALLPQTDIPLLPQTEIIQIQKNQFIQIIRQHIDTLTAGIDSRRRTEKKNALTELVETFQGLGIDIYTAIEQTLPRYPSAQEGYTGALFRVASKTRGQKVPILRVVKPATDQQSIFCEDEQIALFSKILHHILTLHVQIEHCQHSRIRRVIGFFTADLRNPITLKQEKIGALVNLSYLIETQQLNWDNLTNITIYYTKVFTAHGNEIEYSCIDTGNTHALFEEARQLVRNFEKVKAHRQLPAGKDVEMQTLGSP